MNEFFQIKFKKFFIETIVYSIIINNRFRSDDTLTTWTHSGGVFMGKLGGREGGECSEGAVRRQVQLASHHAVSFR